MTQTIKDGEALFAAGRLDEAQACFEALLSEAPSAVLHNNLGVIAFQRGALDDAERHFREALRCDGRHRGAAFNLAETLSTTGRLAEAEPVFARLAALEPDDPHIAEAWELTRDAHNQRGEGSWRFPLQVAAPERADRMSALFAEGLKQLQLGRLEDATLSFERLGRLTEWSAPKIIEKLTEIYRAKQDIPALMELYKRVAVADLQAGRVNAFLEHAYVSIYAEQFFSKAPSYQFARVDWDFHGFIGLLAPQLPIAAALSGRRRTLEGLRRPEKLRVGFVLEGYSATQAPGRTYLPLVEHHDRARYALSFYSRWGHEHPNALRGRYDEYCAQLEAWGAQTRHPPRQLPAYDQIAYLAEQIISDEIDVLVFQTTYFVPGYNLLAALQTAPYQVSIVHQQAEYHPKIDLEFTLPHASLDARARIDSFPMIHNKSAPKAPVARASLGIPEGVVLLISAARAVRYNQPAFWEALGAFLEAHPDVWFLAVGLDALGDLAPEGAEWRGRVVTPGFRDDVLALLDVADIYVNLFPSGSGSSVVEALQQGLPTLCFAEDMARPFRVTENSVARLFVDDPELIVPFGDVEAWAALLDQLVADPELRARKGAAMQQRSQHYLPEVGARRFYEGLEAGCAQKFGAAWLEEG